MSNLNGYITQLLRESGADLVGVGELTALPEQVRCGLPVGVCVAVKFPKDVIRGIADLPTREYYDHYNQINQKLDELVALGARALEERGFRAVAQTRAYVSQYETTYSSLLPHKTVATRAGIGWIGKCALLVTPEYGSMVRLSSILTDAPLETAEPINRSKCASCAACVDACPARALSGVLWDIDTPRDAFFDASACRETALERSNNGFGIQVGLCGKCIEVCPYTRRYLDG